MVVFKSIPNVNDKYLAGSDGNIYSAFARGDKLRKLKGCFDGKGHYLHVSILDNEGKRVSRNIHRMVCEAFHGTSELTAAHKDGNSLNNHPDNLCWKSLKDNHKDRVAHGTHDRGANNSRALLNHEQVKEVKVLLSESSLTHEEIGNMFGVSRVLVTKINGGYRYAD